MVQAVYNKFQAETFTSPTTDNLSNGTDAYKGKKVATNIRTCIPLTIAQVKRRVKPVEDRFLLEGKELTDVCLVGIIRTMVQQQSYNTYMIEDGTGSIDIKQWNMLEAEGLAQQAELNSPEMQTCDVYVKVFGRLQSFSDRMYCVSHSIIRIENGNEVSFHFLNALHAHLEMTIEKKPSFSPFFSHQIGRNNINSIVKRAIKVCGDEEAGSHISNIISHLKNMFTEAEVLKSLDELADDGQIYSLSDEYIHLVNF